MRPVLLHTSGVGRLHVLLMPELLRGHVVWLPMVGECPALLKVGTCLLLLIITAVGSVLVIYCIFSLVIIFDLWSWKSP